MTDTDRELSLQDEDRLPWLEAVDNTEDDEGISSGKLIGFLLAALAALAIVIGGIWWLRNQNATGGDSTLIAAEDGPYKTKPDEIGGMKVEGQGDTSFKTSEGEEGSAKVGAPGTTEAPVAGTKVTEVAPANANAGGATATAAVTTGAKVPTPTPATPAPGFSKEPAAPVATAAPAGTGLIQVGAYDSQESANQAYNAIVGRNGYVSGMAKSIVPAAVGGKSFYRLRLAAGGQADATCKKLKAAGVNCLVVK
jgi:SPOR domain